MHWAAYNADEGVVQYLLDQEGVDPYAYSHDGILPIDIAGHRPAVQCLDVMLGQFQKENDLNQCKQMKSDKMKDIDKILDDFQLPIDTLKNSKAIRKANPAN